MLIKGLQGLQCHSTLWSAIVISWPYTLSLRNAALVALLQASADKAPPLLDIAAALAASSRLAPVLADMSGVPPPAAAAALEPSSEAWAAEQHLGSRYSCIVLLVLLEAHKSRCKSSKKYLEVVGP